MRNADRIGQGIEHRIIVGAELCPAVDKSIGVDRWIAPIGGDGVMHIVFGVQPIPGRDHRIAFDALGPLRLGLRQLTGRHAVGPIGQIIERQRSKR